MERNKNFFHFSKLTNIIIIILNHNKTKRMYIYLYLNDIKDKRIVS